MENLEKWNEEGRKWIVTWLDTHKSRHVGTTYNAVTAYTIAATAINNQGIVLSITLEEN